MKKFFLFLGIITLTLFLFSCTSNKDVSFSVYNDCTDSIQVKYYTFATNDTQMVTIVSGDLNIMLEGKSAQENSNWFYDYKMHIVGIYNALGDSTQFDPNISSNWSLYVGEPFYYYQLHIVDSDF
jgi:hypothetical protein